MRPRVLVALETTAGEEEEEFLCPEPSLELALAVGVVAESATIVGRVLLVDPIDPL